MFYFLIKINLYINHLLSHKKIWNKKKRIQIIYYFLSSSVTFILINFTIVLNKLIVFIK